MKLTVLSVYFKYLMQWESYFM